MKHFIIIVFVLFFMVISPAVFASPVEFENLNVASEAYGVTPWAYRPRVMAAYKNKIYFILLDVKQNSPPSKVYCYDPTDGLSNAANHSIVDESAGVFNTVRVINDLLYMADTLGKVYTYDGTTLTEIDGTPFSESNYVNSIVEFYGMLYFGTSNSKVFRYDGVSYEPVYEPNEDRKPIADMITWQKDGRLYVSIASHEYCCPPSGYVIRSNSGDLNSWETVFQGFFNAASFLPTSDVLYTTVTDNAGGPSSTLRKSSDGLSFPIIHQSGGQYKVFRGSLYHDGIPYFFVNSHRTGGYGYRIIDDSGNVSLVQNQNITLTNAVELNERGGTLFRCCFILW